MDIADALKYVDADPKLDAKAKNDWKQMVEADQRNIDSLKKAME
jgi:hypothetical protein